MLKYEAKICKINFLDYLAVCYNGRLGWVPFIKKFGTRDDYEKFYDKYKNIKTDELVLDYGLARYQFSEETGLQLINAIHFFPLAEEQERERLTLCIGSSFKNITYEILEKLQKEAGEKKIKVRISDCAIIRLISN